MIVAPSHIDRLPVRNRQRFRWALVVSGLALLAVLGLVLPNYYTGILTEVLIFAIFALSLNLLVGYTGLPSFGHAALFGGASYTVAILFVNGIENFWITAAAGVLASVMIAAIFALLALRTTGAYFVMITLALGQVIWAIAYGWRSVTNGDDGLVGIPRPDLGFLPWSMWEASNYFLFCLVVTVAVAAALFVVANSPFGYALQGIRESESRMRALGYNTWLFKFLAFLMAGGCAGIGGVLFIYNNGFITPQQVGVQLSAEGLLMVIVGGAGHPFGPILGAGLIVIMRDIVSSYVDRWVFLLGIIFVLVVLFARQGVLAAVQDALSRKSEAYDERPGH